MMMHDSDSALLLLPMLLILLVLLVLHDIKHVANRRCLAKLTMSPAAANCGCFGN